MSRKLSIESCESGMKFENCQINVYFHESPDSDFDEQWDEDFDDEEDVDDDCVDGEIDEKQTTTRTRTSRKKVRTKTSAKSRKSISYQRFRRPSSFCEA